jgi:endonuclease/exonuclease/phosphatase family metal-dependent hydrolase
MTALMTTQRRPLNLTRVWWVVWLLIPQPLVWSQASGKSDAGQLRVVTYNIRHALGTDNQVDLNRVGQVLQRLTPDIVALQEVDRGATRSGGVDQAAVLGQQLGLHQAFGSFMEFQGGQYGMAILSRYPILKSTAIKLPEGNEPRVALAAELQMPDGSQLLVVNVHFDWVRDDRFRWAQAEAVKLFLETWPTPYLLLGDFNDLPESRTLKMLGRDLLEAAKPANDRFTFSSTTPEIEIDYIFAGPANRWNVDAVEVIQERTASDHRPVVATLKLR